jgi:hypothetical protein
MDHCFGAGKTSLAWKFRGLLRTMDPVLLSPFKDDKLQRLYAAVYLHIPFRNDLLPPGFIAKSDITPADFDHFICSRISTVLHQSCANFSTCHSIDELLHLLGHVARSTTFLFHFDDVGAFELPNPEVGKKMIYRMWIIAERLRDRGDYFLLTGRSAHLHLIGKVPLGVVGFESPNRTVLISLSVLSSESIRKMFLEHKAVRVHGWIEEHLAAVTLLTGGIPRAVTSVLRYITMCSPHRELPHPEDEHLILDLKNNCNHVFSDVTEAKLFSRLTELAWAEIDFNPDTAKFDGEAITSIIARLGVYTVISPHDPKKCCLVISLLQLRSQSWSPRSLQAISEYDTPGARLETGFRRVLHLRMSFGGVNNWSTVGLPYLDMAGVPYPAVALTNAYPFPKIHSQGKTYQGHVDKFMDAVHKQSAAVPQQIFPFKTMSALYNLMKVGQYYQPLPMSKSADAKIRCSIDCMCDFQFKNFQRPFTLADAKAEAIKSTVPGWRVFLVVVCAAGHNVQDSGNDVTVMLENVKVILLSKASVEAFLGRSTLSAIQSVGLLADSVQRTTLTSPLK